MGRIGCIRCEKSRCDFVARTFALVQNVSPRVSQGNQMVANAPKWYETHQNMSLRSNGVDRVCSLRKTPRTFALVRNVWPRLPLGNLTIPNAPKQYETHQNMSLGSNGLDLVVRCENHNVNSWHKFMY